jgi:hypothetical protein
VVRHFVTIKELSSVEFANKISFFIKLPQIPKMAGLLPDDLVQSQLLINELFEKCFRGGFLIILAARRFLSLITLDILLSLALNSSSVINPNRYFSFCFLLIILPQLYIR